MENAKLVSVIVPVYNMQEYLDACMESIVRQTYSNLEIILVNDGSQDDSLSCCKRWAQSDLRIDVYDNTNHGVSFTRNFGIEKSCGEYITFVDADDIVSEYYVEMLVGLMEGHRADLAAVSLSAFQRGSALQFSRKGKTEVFYEALDSAVFSHLRGMAWGKLYKRELIEKHRICFDTDISVTEDLQFVLQYVNVCQSAVYMDSPLYGYRQRAGSAAHNTVSSRWFSCLLVYRRLFLNYRQSKAYPVIVYHYLKTLYEARYSIKRKGASPGKYEIDFVTWIKDGEQEKGRLSSRERLKLFVCKHLFFVIEIKRRWGIEI